MTNSTPSLSQIAASLGKRIDRRSGTVPLACPVHGGKNPSSAVIGSRRDGGLWAHCRAQSGESGDILRTLGIRTLGIDSSEPWTPPAHVPRPAGPKPEFGGPIVPPLPPLPAIDAADYLRARNPDAGFANVGRGDGRAPARPQGTGHATPPPSRDGPVRQSADRAAPTWTEVARCSAPPFLLTTGSTTRPSVRSTGPWLNIAGVPPAASPTLLGLRQAAPAAEVGGQAGVQIPMSGLPGRA